MSEYCFHAAASREGILATTNGTQETGDIYRHMHKALEGVIVAQNGSVINGTGRGRESINSFVVGGDGMSPLELFTIKLNGRLVKSFIDLPQIAQRLNVEAGFEPGNRFDIG